MPNDVTPVELSAAGGVTLRGEALGVSDRWVVLVHDEGDDLGGWRGLPARLAVSGLSTLAIDLRGHGLSDGPWSDGDAARESAVADIRSAIDWAHTHGARTIGLAGAGSTASALMDVSATGDVAAVVLLSPDSSGARALRPPVAKLIMFGGHSARATDAARAWQASAVGETILVDLPASEQGCALIHGSVATHVGEHIDAFLGRHLGIEPRELERHA